MKHALSCALGVIASGMITLAPNLAYADAVGPYYATPSWDQTLPSSTRFIALSNMNSDAVLDRETGLVWEKSPSTTTVTWVNAQAHCNFLRTGGRVGWRLPTVQELASLVDPSIAFPGPTLPAGHPFTNVQSSDYWSATTQSQDTTSAWVVEFQFGGPASGSAFAKSGRIFAWCVRGGQGSDPQ
jgi:hypothetical protein